MAFAPLDHAEDQDAGLDLEEPRGGDAVGEEYLLRHDLVERDGQAQAVRSYERYAGHLQEHGYLGLTVAPRDTLGDVEDDVNVELADVLYQAVDVADFFYLISAGRKGLGDDADGKGMVELGIGVRWVVFFELVIGLKVVCQAYSHGFMGL